MIGSVMKLHAAVQRLDKTFPELLQGLVTLAQLAKDAAGAKGRLAQLVQNDFHEYIVEVAGIIERLTFLNNSLSRLIGAAKKVMEENKA